MPGLVAPPEAPPLRVDVPESPTVSRDQSQIRRSAGTPEPRQARPPSPAPKKGTPSPGAAASASTSRAKPGTPSPSSASAAAKRRLSLERASPSGTTTPGAAAAARPSSLASLAGGVEDEAALDNPDLGPFLLKLARDAIASGEGPIRALEYATRASRSFERFGKERSLELAMSLHVAAAICCSLGRHEEAVAALERAVAVVEALREPAPEGTEGDAAATSETSPEQALAAFSGYMQLGDTHAMVGRMEQSIACYSKGLQIQTEALGENDPRVAETCRYLAEAHMQAMQFDEAERLCRRTLEIHREHSAPASLEEAADRRLMALVCEAKGDPETALEHLVLASMAMIAQGQEADVASVDVSIGNTYLSLGRFDEAVFSYQKALTVFKSTKGDNHPAVASVFVRLADLYYKTGKLRESKSYCENALRIYAKPVPGTSNEDIAGGLMEIAAIYEAMNEPEEALKQLQKALKLLEDAPGQWSTVAGVEAQMGIMYYMIGSYGEARASFESAVTKLRASGERKSAFFGVLLNQMALANVQLFKIDEAAELFEESKAILEQECGSIHPDTLGVYSNLAATYDAMGRVDDAIEMLEHVVKAREEKLGTANPDVDDEKKRLAELLKEAGRSRNRKQKSLENLMVTNSQRAKKETTRRWSALGFKS